MNSPFDARSFGRIFWKEYRTQRSVWIALLIGALLIELPFILFDESTKQGLLGYPFVIAAVLAVCYGIVSTAMLFAGEREEETDRFLQSLPLNKPALFAGKLTFSLVSLSLFCVFAVLGAIAVSWLAGPKFLAINTSGLEGRSFQDTVPIFAFSLPFLAFAIPFGFVAGLAASLAAKRVITAIVCGALLMIVVLGVAHNSMRDWSPAYDAIGFGIIIGLAGALMPAWLNGKDIVSEVSQRLKWLIQSTGSPWEQEVRRRHTLALLALPLGTFLYVLGQAVLFHVWSQPGAAQKFVTYVQFVIPIPFLMRSSSPEIWFIGSFLSCGLAWGLSYLSRNPYVSLIVLFATVLTTLGILPGLYFALALCILMAVRNVFVGFGVSIAAILLVAHPISFYLGNALLRSFNAPPGTGLSVSGNTIHDVINLSGVPIAAALTVFLIADFLLTRWGLAGKLSWTQDALLRQSETPEKTARQPWLSRYLSWAALRPTLEGRLFATLVWKELRVARPIFIMALLTCIAAIFWEEANRSLTGGRHSHSKVSDSVLFFCSNLFLLWCVVIGQAVWGSDQREQNFRFLADRGTSPMRAWLAKQLVWLPMIAGLTVVALFLWIRADFWDNELLRMYWDRADQRLTELPLLIHKNVDQAKIIVSCLWSIYAVSQLLSLWLHQRILSASMAFMVGLLLLMGHVGIAQFHLPLWLTSVPITVASLAASYFTLHGWLMQDRSWKYQWTKVAWVVCPLLLVTVAIREWRIYEIPLITPGFDWRQHEQEMAEFDPEWSDLWETLSEAVAVAHKRDLDGLKFDFLAELAADRIQENPSLRLDPRLRLKQDKIVQTFYDIWIRNRVGSSQVSLEDQWNELRTAMVLNAYEAGIGPELQFGRGMMKQLEIDVWLRIWIQDSRQTPELLDEYLSFHLPQSNDLYRSIKNQYVMLRQMLEQRGWAWEEMKAKRQGFPEEIVAFTKFPLSLLVRHELQRAVRLLNWKTNLDMEGYCVYPPDGEVLRKLEQWAKNDPIPDSLVLPNGSAAIQAYFEKYYDEVSATSLLARLEKYRLQHGSYPEGLDMLITPEDEPHRWHLQYLPQGFSKPFIVSSTVVVPPGQPLLRRFSSASSVNTKTPYDILTQQKRQEYEVNPRTREVLKQLNANDFYWDWDWYSALDRTRPADAKFQIVESILNMPAKTDRIRYVVSGEDDPAPKIEAPQE